MRVRRAVAATGRLLIATGVLLLLFVAYQLWGTGIATAREQRSLKADLERQLGFDPTVDVAAGQGASTTTTIAPATTAPGATTTTAPGDRPGPTAPLVSRLTDPGNTPTTVFRSKKPPVPVRAGEAVGYLKIPDIDVGWAFVAGTTTEALKKGPGHYQETPMPGQPGNAAIAGHRTTYGAPFYRLDELDPGDPIFVVTKQGRFRYEVTRLRVVSPSAVDVLDPVPGKNLLTLTTCHPRFSAAKRLVVIAQLIGEAAEADVAPPTTAPPTTTPPSVATPVPPGDTVPFDSVPVDSVPADSVPADSVPAETTIAGGAGDEPTLGRGSLGDAEDRGSWRLGWLAGDPAVWGDTAAWAMVCVAIWMLAWAVARRRLLLLTWLGTYVAFTLPFLVALYFTYENLARLLPANV